MKAFVAMRKVLLANEQVLPRIERLEHGQIEAGKQFEKVFKAIEDKGSVPQKGIFFDGQVFDAYTFVSDLIRKAKKSIVLMDNYVDDTVLTLLTKRQKNVSAEIYTKNVSKKLELDLEKHNAQYPLIKIKEFKRVHDRFLILDDNDVYHFGASLKDLGKSIFAFSKLDRSALSMLESLKKDK